jgi:thiamine-phosphate pyrophosphorylase
LRLIALTDLQSMSASAVEAAAGASLGAGLPALMLRDRALDRETLMPLARRLRTLTRAAGSLLILNRRLDLAGETEPDGMHLGKEGPTIREVRENLGPEMLIGYSAHGEAEALDAFSAGAHYVFLSPIFETPSKRGILEPVGLERLSEFVKKAPGPVIALGGISPANAVQVMETGAHGVAVLRAVLGTPDPALATRRMLERITDCQGRYAPSRGRPIL